MKVLVILISENQRKKIQDFFISKNVEVFSEVKVNGYRPVYHDNPTPEIKSPIEVETETNNSEEDVLRPMYSLMMIAILPELVVIQIMDEIRILNESKEFAQPAHAYQINIERVVG